MKEIHENVSVEDTGFFINPDAPFFGTSPDGFLKCDCCGQCVLEIKCPLCVKNKKIDEIEGNKSLCLKKLHLGRKHMYFYQVQTQLGACKLHMACFVVWTADDLYFEQNTFDKMCLKEKHIFYTAILPELVGKFYTRLPKSDVVIAARNLPVQDVQTDGSQEITHNPGAHAHDDEKSLSETEPTWCYCGQVEFFLQNLVTIVYLESTIEMDMFTQAQQINAILSIKVMPSLLLAKNSRGSGPFKMVYLCLTLPITRSTCIPTCAVCLVVSTSTAHIWDFPFVNAGILASAIIQPRVSQIHDQQESNHRG